MYTVFSCISIKQLMLHFAISHLYKKRVQYSYEEIFFYGKMMRLIMRKVFELAVCNEAKAQNVIVCISVEVRMV